ncbi:MAG: aldose 1-epimerase family protein [Romboutsia sp.]|uniref:aldose 1-epimerase family protein n=1 Tax=Romboutsia sp. TaxID=1965302 RepID=UPI003F2EBA3C
MNILQNDNLIVESTNHGAELTRIYSKKFDKDILWNGDNRFWGRRSPILFPIVGRLKNNQTAIENNTYAMGQHGFARDMDFEVIASASNLVSYKLTSNEKTKQYYPYCFDLVITYTLNDTSINVNWSVTNTDCKDIHFSIGAHPAFNIDNNSLAEYYLECKCRDNIEKIDLEGPFASKRTSIDILEKINLSAELFENDALIYTNIDEIAIKSNKDDHAVRLTFTNFPLVGIWTPYYKESNSVAPFICIEPWYGLADDINTNGDYIQKHYLNKLSVNEEFKVSYDISID